MTGLATLGWAPDTLGELDHRRLKVPSLKLRGTRTGAAGDTVYSIDLRVRRPNSGAHLAPAEAHSMEHFLLEGFQRLLPRHFIGVGVMGCRTGFYLTLLNEGRRTVIEDALQQILHDTLDASAVPYARIEQCGNWQDHDLACAQALAREVLAGRSRWSEVA